uniref:SMB domain-containing protein n=1 Tax=Timema genevievae TaxID=629358 RepID=A0A7R9K7R1_TIMGE|nr:unnamed protein product [Timema genevievae]
MEDTPSSLRASDPDSIRATSPEARLSDMLQLKLSANFEYRTCMFLCFMVVATLLFPAVSCQQDYSDLRGSYCASRREGCCPGRRDGCSTPILGTLCYCDDFCNRTRSEDCCPDFWSHCKGIETPPEETRSSVNTGGNRLGWRASNYTAFWGRRLDEGISLRLGTLLPHKAVMSMNPVKPVYDPERLPRSFDSRTKWRGLIQEVKDQGWCGSSWALSTAAVASDRFAIISEGKEAAQLSPQHLLSCNNRGQRGCQGGHLDKAWLYLRKFGVVSEECYPYQSSGGETGRCRLPKNGNLVSASCRPLLEPRTEFYKVGPAYRLGDEQDIMYEIMESGPVQATMKVSQDFFVYRSGVYRQTMLGATHRTGYHSVRILGWGEEVNRAGETVKYWLVANSWGSLWGENGYFRIRRGENECEIEDFVLASWAHTLDSLQGHYRPSNNNRFSNNI